jgi:feruloyl-CoA synthase
MNVQHASQAGAPVRSITYAPVDVSLVKAADGSLRYASRAPLDPYDPSLANLFRSAVERAPQRIMIAEREGDGWRTVRFEHARTIVDALAAALLERGLSADRPVMVLSANSVDQALLMLASYTAGVPIAPVSVAYSLQSQDHGKLKFVAKLLTPGLIYVADTGPFAKALAAVAASGAEIVTSRNSANLEGVTLLDDLMKTKPTRAVDETVARIDGDRIAKFLFTSGSTDVPKAVINTHRMLTANQQSLSQIWPFLREEEDHFTLVDWLPWSHTFGGNHNFHMALKHAGTFYIDAGKPVPALVEQTIRNLAEVSPTIYFNVPAGYAAILPFLEKDPALAKTFFAKLRMIFYAAAALPQDLWTRLEAVSVRATGQRVPLTSSWGATETAPAVTATYFPLDRAGVIGVPMPGPELKLVPTGDRWEVRVKGPNVTPGYWRSPDITKKAFDEDGFYRIGDAVRFADPNNPAAGLVYSGRLTEEFKLTTGTWVLVGALRVGLLSAMSPIVQDVVIAGEGCDHLRIMAWLNVAGCRQLLGDDAPSTAAEFARNPSIHDHIRESLKRWNSENTGQSTRIRSALLLGDAPSIDVGEITDKGYINQRAALLNRKAELERLFGTETHPDIVHVDA